MNEKSAGTDLLIETSWEVCNKVGGIYTVLSTKAHNLQRLYHDRAIFIGPDVWTAEHQSPYFKESKTLLAAWRNQLLLPEGVGIRVGRWEVPGRPIAILVRFDGIYAIKDQIYGDMWKWYGVDSLHAYGDYDEACAFSIAAAYIIKDLADYMAPASGNAKVIAHFDEWTTGMGLLYTKHYLPRAATVFTTHATSIGRSICGNGKALYAYFHGYNGDQMAAELNMQSKHSLEKAAAHAADIFTTVSEITADECEQLLERRPDVVTPNGFEKDFVPGPRKYAQLRKKARARILEVASTLTGVKYAEDTFIIATSGRHEYRNKGLDMYLDATENLRCRLSALKDSQRRILSLILVPAWSSGPRQDLMSNLAEGIHQRLQDPYLTHWLNNDDSDEVAIGLRRLGVTNATEDRLHTIYVPCYLTGEDGIFDIDYYTMLTALDATVFPSYYEPWGYTPLESVAFGVPTITTSLSGFGRWARSLAKGEYTTGGVCVIDRDDSNYDRACENIATSILQLYKATPDKLAIVAKACRETATLATWDNLIAQYITAYRDAIAKAEARQNK